MRRLGHVDVPRCARCRLPPRWCVCPAHRAIRSPLQVDVLMHEREHFRPSSTGHLIHRLWAGSRLWLWRGDRTAATDELRAERPEFWILHPHGDPVPVGVPPESVQVLLLDGAWSEASAMARVAAPRGKLVRLDMTGESRFWLRDQQEGGRFSTAEALLSLLGTLGLVEARGELERQFELHVYAHLRARGRKEIADRFLEASPLPAAFPELLAQLNVRRPRVD